MGSSQYRRTKDSSRQQDTRPLRTTWLIAAAIVGLSIVLSVGATQASAQAPPTIHWEAEAFQDDVNFDASFFGTVAGRGRISLAAEFWQDEAIVWAGRGARGHFLDYDWRSRSFELRLGFQPILLDRPLTIRLTATDPDGRTSVEEAVVEFGSPTATLTSIAEGQSDVGYPFELRGTTEDPWSDQPYRVRYQHGDWEFIRPVRANDGTWSSRFEPRRVQGWVWSDEPWIVTLELSFSSERSPVGVTRVSFTSEEIAGYCYGYAATVDLAAGDTPTSDSDIILGTDGNDRIDAGDGDDVICAGGGVDRIWGRNGNDIILGGENRDFIDAGDGDDLIFAGTGPDRVKLGDGDDHAFGEGGSDILRGGKGNDRLLGGGGANEILGGVGDDFVNSGNPRSTGDGGPGRDQCWKGTTMSCEVETVPVR